MQRFKLIIGLCVALLCSGCGVLEKEMHNRGGYLDYLADEYIVKADSKKMRALRALAVQVSLARIASVSSKNDSDRQLLAMRIGNATSRSENVFRCTFENNPLQAGDPCFFFDSLMVDYSTALFDLALMALPLEDGRRLIDSVAGSVMNPANIVELLPAFYDVGKQALKLGRVTGALYRDAQELEVQVWLGSPFEPNEKIPQEFRVTEERVKPLRDIYDRGNDDMDAWRREIGRLRMAGLEPIPQKKFVGELFGVMSYICDLITKEPIPNKVCKAGNQPLLTSPPTAGKPVASTGMSVFRTFAGVRSPRAKVSHVTAGSQTVALQE